MTSVLKQDHARMEEVCEWLDRPRATERPSSEVTAMPSARES
jgi:hypothetical protein